MAKKKTTDIKYKSMDISYDSKAKCLVGVLTVVDDKGVEARLEDKKITNLEAILKAIQIFSVGYGMTPSELVANNIVDIDKSVKDSKGIIVYNETDKKYYKLIYDLTDKQIFRDGGIVDEKLVNNVRVNWKAVAALGATVVLGISLWVYAYLHKNDEKNRTVSNNDKRITDEQKEETNYGLPGVDLQEPDTFTHLGEEPAREEPTIDSSFELPAGEEPAREVPGFADNQEYVEVITKNINDACWPCIPCDFCDLADANDRDAIQVINNARNDVINNKNSIYFLMDDYARYMFEGSTMFDGRTIKGFDYLDPMSKYVVVVSAQTVAQKLCPRDSIYDLQSGLCDFNQLMEKFDNAVDEVYNVELLGNSRTR